MKVMKFVLRICVLAAVMLVGWIHFHAERVSPYDVNAIKQARAQGVHVGGVAPTFTSETLAGKQGGYQPGPRYTVMHFFATWCYPCQEEMPFIVRIDEQLSVQGDTFVAVNLTSEGDRRSDLPAFLSHFGATFDPVLDEDGEIQRLYQVVGIPTTIVIDQDGVVADRITGALSPEAMRKWVSF